MRALISICKSQSREQSERKRMGKGGRARQKQAGRLPILLTLEQMGNKEVRSTVDYVANSRLSETVQEGPFVCLLPVHFCSAHI